MGLAGGVQDDLAGDGRAAGRIDALDDGFDGVVPGGLLERETDVAGEAFPSLSKGFWLL